MRVDRLEMLPKWLEGMPVTIISLHLPKTAGTSFRYVLRQHFGVDYRDDYADLPISRSLEDRQRDAMRPAVALTADSEACIHGHFLPYKYLAMADQRPLTFVTWLRHPIERLISHYHFWLATYHPVESAPHHRQMVEEAWTFEQFGLSERFRNLYMQYLWQFPLERFDFVGISEHYQDDLREFSARYLAGSPCEIRRENAARAGTVRERPSAELLKKLHEFHSADMELYRTALARRQSRQRVLAVG